MGGSIEGVGTGVEKMAGRDLDAYRNHHEAIRQEYGRQAPNWATTEISPHLRWVVGNLDLRPDFAVLDVAAGTGLLGRAIAPHVGRVVAADITGEMLARGREESERDGLTNIVFEHGTAEDLPYPDDAFDLVATRFSAHHFLRPEAVISEMRRVCRSGGKVAVIDLTSPEDERLAERYNGLERLRDRTHTRALSARELDELVREAGLGIVARHSREVEMNADRWLDTAQAGPAERAEILAAMNAELGGSGATGLRPFVRDDELMFVHFWEMIVAEKP